MEVEGCPTLLRTDRGTENTIISSAQCFLRRNGTDSHAGLKAHRFSSSHSNQRIEACMVGVPETVVEFLVDKFP